MAQFGKSGSKKGKPTYIYAIIGVALVLFLFGLMGWLFLGLQKSSNLMKERMEVHVFLNRISTNKQIDSLKKFITAQPYTKDVKYISKAEAAEKYTEIEKDTSWKTFLEGFNPFEASIDFSLKASYIQKDTLQRIDSLLKASYGHLINEVKYPLETVKTITTFANWTMGVLLALVIILGIIVIISIDNTIRLAMYSNRFIMKTMQMVGATRGFITKPLLVRAVINGLIAAGLAILAVLSFVWVAEKFVVELTLIRDNTNMVLLFTLIVVLGVTICVGSTYRSVLKYLRMKLDDLY
jgi:cell division transport system permease protein